MQSVSSAADPAITPGPALIVGALKAAGVDFVAGLPESKLAGLQDLIEADPHFTWVTVCREEEAIGICTGAYCGGRKTAVVMQNGGLLVSTNALTSTGLMYEIPMVLLVYYAGDINDRFFSTVGENTEPVLQALGIRYYVLRDKALIHATVTGAAVLAEDSQRPVAVLLTKPVLLA
jgi:sulfopyruvate decarboxylase subunit alpha